MSEAADPAEYAEAAGDVISVYRCDECGEDLRVEFREEVPAHMIGLACPEGCTGFPVRLRDAARLDEVFDTRHVPRCWHCQDEILSDAPPETDEGYPLHPGECAESYREDMRRLEMLGGGDE